MKILHIIKEGTPPGHVDTIIEDQSNAGNEVTVVNITEDKDYAKLVKLIEESDRVMTW
jgi:hypothetical protein